MGGDGLVDSEKGGGASLGSNKLWKIMCYSYDLRYRLAISVICSNHGVEGNERVGQVIDLNTLNCPRITALTNQKVSKPNSSQLHCSYAVSKADMSADTPLVLHLGKCLDAFG